MDLSDMLATLLLQRMRSTYIRRRQQCASRMEDPFRRFRDYAAAPGVHMLPSSHPGAGWEPPKSELQG